MSSGKWHLFCLGLNVLKMWQDVVRCIRVAMSGNNGNEQTNNKNLNHMYHIILEITPRDLSNMQPSLVDRSYHLRRVIYYIWHIHGSWYIICMMRNLANVMTLSHRNIFRITGPLWGESIGHRWIPLTKTKLRGALFSLICAWTNGWANNRDTGDLRHHRGHYDVIVMNKWCLPPGTHLWCGVAEYVVVGFVF